MNRYRHSVVGFTLVEVMVALAVVALALPALLVSLNQEISGTAHLRDKSLAHAVAVNKLAELRLLGGAQGRLLQGRESGVASMAGRDWYWWQESEATEVEDFYRVEVRVGDTENEGDQTLFTLVGFIASASGEADGG